MKKSEALVLYRNLNQLGGLTGVRFSYAIAKNVNLLKGEIESLDKAMEPAKEFMEFEKERVELVEKYAEKDENGKPKKEVAPNGSQQYVMNTGEKKFQKEFDELKKKHKDAVEAREKQIEEYTKLLSTDSDFVPHKVKLEDVPKDVNARQMAGIYEIVEE